MTTLLFRFHRGGLDESMQTVTEIHSMADLINLTQEKWGDMLRGISIEPYGYDERIQWDTYIVTAVVGTNQDRVSAVVGFLNGNPKIWKPENDENS